MSAAALPARVRFALTLIAAVAAASCVACGEDVPEGPGATTVMCGAGERRVTTADGQTVCESLSVTSAPDTTDAGPLDADDDTGHDDDTTVDDTMDAPDTTAPDTRADTSPVDVAVDLTDTAAPDTTEPDATDAVDADDATDDGDAPVVVGEFRRFVAIGDVGEGSSEQYHVATSIATTCGMLGGCDFGMLLGDNFYDSGVDSDMDPLFDSHFAQPYGPLGFPFYVVLGNHDLGGDGLGVDLDPSKGDYQVAYGQTNPQWKMPSKHYQVDEGPLWLVGLNTTDIFFDNDASQYSAVSSWLAQYDAAGETGWKIAFGHHPYKSNGKHGNAGEYEGIPDVGSWSDIPRGKHVKDFFEDNICNNFDLYLAGHDHSRQDLVASCGVELIVSGAGAKTTEVEGSGPNHFQADTTGFVIIDATEERLDVQFYDRDGVLEHSRAITR